MESNATISLSIFWGYGVKARGRAATQKGSGHNITKRTAEREGGNTNSRALGGNKRRWTRDVWVRLRVEGECKGWLRWIQKKKLRRGWLTGVEKIMVLDGG